MDKDYRKLLSMLINKYTANPSIIGDTKIYIGTEIRKVDYGNVFYAWKLISYSYDREAIMNVNKQLKDKRMEFNKNLSDMN